MSRNWLRSTNISVQAQTVSIPRNLSFNPSRYSHWISRSKCHHHTTLRRLAFNHQPHPRVTTRKLCKNHRSKWSKPSPKNTLFQLRKTPKMFKFRVLINTVNPIPNQLNSTTTDNLSSFNSPKFTRSHWTKPKIWISIMSLSRVKTDTTPPYKRKLA